MALQIIRDAPNKYHFKTKDAQQVNIEHRDRGIVLNLFKWGEEASLQIILDTVPTTNHTFTENKIEVENPDFILRVYPIETRSTRDFYRDSDDVVQCHDGGIRFELVLKKERPAMGNSLLFPLVAKNLRVAHQSFLTQEEIDQGIIRPLNVEDSYVFHHTTKRNNEYMTGKAFHLFRPIAEDDLGNKAWCSIDIDPQITRLILTIPQPFLDEATYPITIDPDFGYTAIGGSWAYIASTSEVRPYRAGSAWTWPATCTANYIRAYVYGNGLVTDCRVFINQKDSAGANSHDQIATDENLACAVAAHWEEFTLAGEALTAAIVYILNIWGDEFDPGGKDKYYVAYDENGAVASYIIGEGGYGAPEDPWTSGAPEATTRDYSIYCNYTAAAGWTGKISGVTNPAEVAGVAVANIAEVKGVA